MSSGYRPPSREPRGRWARHIHAERKRLGWSATVAFERLLEAGYPLGAKSRSAYLPVDEGKRDPKPEEEAALVKVFGYPPEKEEPAPPVGEAGQIVEAIKLQTQAIEELARVVREGQDRQSGSFDGLADGLLALLARLVSEHAAPVVEAAPRRAARR